MECPSIVLGDSDGSCDVVKSAGGCSTAGALFPSSSISMWVVDDLAERDAAKLVPIAA
jgi:hypothetical protein